jgi:hypothetical protein
LRLCAVVLPICVRLSATAASPDPDRRLSLAAAGGRWIKEALLDETRDHALVKHYVGAMLPTGGLRSWATEAQEAMAPIEYQLLPLWALVEVRARMHSPSAVSRLHTAVSHGGALGAAPTLAAQPCALSSWLAVRRCSVPTTCGLQEPHRSSLIEACNEYARRLAPAADASGEQLGVIAASSCAQP